MLCTRQVHVGTTTLLYTKTNLHISDRAKNLINNKESFGDLFTGAFCLCVIMRDVDKHRPLQQYNIASLVILPQRAGSLGTPLSGRWLSKAKPEGLSPVQCDLSHRNYSLFIFHYSFIDAVRHKCRTLRFFLQAMLAPATHIKKRALRLSFY